MTNATLYNKRDRIKYGRLIKSLAARVRVWVRTRFLEAEYLEKYFCFLEHILILELPAASASEATT